VKRSGTDRSVLCRRPGCPGRPGAARREPGARSTPAQVATSVSHTPRRAFFGGQEGRAEPPRSTDGCGPDVELQDIGDRGGIEMLRLGGCPPGLPRMPGRPCPSTAGAVVERREETDRLTTKLARPPAPERRRSARRSCCATLSWNQVLQDRDRGRSPTRAHRRLDGLPVACPRNVWGSATAAVVVGADRHSPQERGRADCRGDSIAHDASMVLPPRQGVSAPPGIGATPRRIAVCRAFVRNAHSRRT